MRLQIKHCLVLPCLARDYKGLQGITGGYKGLQGITKGYRRLQGIIGGYKG